MRESWQISSTLFSVRKQADWLGDSPDLWAPDLHLDLDQAGSSRQSELMIVSIARSLCCYHHGYMVTWLYMVITFVLYSIWIPSISELKFLILTVLRHQLKLSVSNQGVAVGGTYRLTTSLNQFKLFSIKQTASHLTSS